jgi:hypothetical protein
MPEPHLAAHFLLNEPCLARRPALGVKAWCAGLLLTLPAGAWAQGGACEQLRASLAARLNPGLRGYTMEVAPASASVPRGAKVIGNCEGGAKKIIYWRYGKPASAAEAVSPAPAPAPAPAPKALPAPAPAARSMAEPTRAIVAAAPAPAPQPPQPPEPAPRPVSPAGVATETAPAAPPLQLDKAPVSTLTRAAASASAVEVKAAPSPAGALDSRGAEPEPGATTSPGGTQAAGPWLSSPWAWAAGAGLVSVLLGLWVWLAHRSAYDAAGLPRGPRLR